MFPHFSCVYTLGMAINLDLSRDFEDVVDNLEPAWFEVSNRTGDAARVYLPVAKRRALTLKELAASGGVYTGRDKVWLFPQRRIPASLKPKPADVLIDTAGERWTVLDVQHGKWGQTWRLTTRNRVIAEDLRDLIQIERAQIEYDEAGVATKYFPPDTRGQTIYRDLPCRVQPQQSDIAEERGIRGFRTQYLIYVDREVSITNEDRILWEGQYLEIRGYRSSQLITDLPVISAEAAP